VTKAVVRRNVHDLLLRDDLDASLDLKDQSVENRAFGMIVSTHVRHAGQRWTYSSPKATRKEIVGVGLITAIALTEEG
jgi:hypothetical protein